MHLHRMTLVPENKTAWFSSSVPKSAVKAWVQVGGIVVPNPLKAEFVFSENSECEDVKKLFKSEQFLDGRLAVLSSNLVVDALTEKFNCLDVREYVILPRKEFNKLGIFVSGLKEGDLEKVAQGYGLSKNDEVDRLKKNQGCSLHSQSKPLQGTVKSSSDIRDNDYTRSIFYHSLNFDIIHLDDICVPPVRLMDFKPGVNGCRVVKKRTGICQKHYF